MFKQIFLLLIMLTFSNNLFAQLILDFSPKDTRMPVQVLMVEKSEYSSAEVYDTFQFDIDESSVEYSEEYGRINLGFFYYSTSVRTVQYNGFENDSDTISTGNVYSITKEDLPVKLYKDYGYIGIPIWVGDGRVNLFYGELTLTDGEDVSDEDVVKFIDVEYYFTPEEESSWLVGWYYADAFGGIYNVPFLGYMNDSNDMFEVEVVFPVKWNVAVAFENGWILGVGQQVEGEAYRLTEKEPWNSAIVSFTGIKSSAILGYQFSNGLNFKIEGGSITQQKIEFYDESISVSPSEISEESYLSDDIPALELSLADTSYYAISIAWGF